jgi:DNA polymerase-1
MSDYIRKYISDQHLEQLRASTLTDETIELNNLKTIGDSKKHQSMLSMKFRPNFQSCLAFPYYDIDGNLARYDRDGKATTYLRLKPDVPRKDEEDKPVKYEAPFGTPSRPYFPRNRFDDALPIIVVEGEKKSLAVAQLRFQVVGVSGIWNWCKKGERDEHGKRQGDYELLDDLANFPWKTWRDILICFDSDTLDKDNGPQAEWQLAQAIKKKGGKVKIIRVPKPEGGGKNGIDDWLAAIEPEDRLLAFINLVKAAVEPTEPPKKKGKKKTTSGNSGGEGPKESVADRLVRYAIDAGVKLFHTADEDTYALIPCGDRQETRSMKSRAFKDWLGRLLWQKEQKSASGEALNSVVGTLRGGALFDSEQHDVHVRFAEHGGAVYLDLGDPAWQIIQIDADGWRAAQTSPVKFCRGNGSLSLPVPISGGSLDLLRPFINVKGEDNWRLLLGWLFAAMRASGPFPVLSLGGEQGSAKSTLGRILKRLIDPSKASLRREPKCPHDLAIAASKGHCLAYDNLSSIPAWLSDALCCLATGGGWSTREYFTDSDEVIFEAMKPIILTSITDVVTASDLIDRTVNLQLEIIPAEERKPEKVLWRKFDEAHPQILGAVLDGLSAGLRTLPTLDEGLLPRMADFALWGEACLRGIGHKPRAFLLSYGKNIGDANVVAIEACPYAQLLLSDEWQDFDGSMADLLKLLNDLADEKTQKQKTWPNSVDSLGRTLRRIAPNLRREGLVVEFYKSGHRKTRCVKLRRGGDQGGGGDDDKGDGSTDTTSPEKDREKVSAVSQVSAPAENPQEIADPADTSGVRDEVSAEVSADLAENAGKLRHADTSDTADTISRLLSGSLPDGTPWRLVAEPADIPVVLQAIDESERIGLDTETTGLNQRTDRVRLLQLATDRGVFVIDAYAAAPDLSSLWGPLAEKELIIHNASFDLGFLGRLGFIPGKVFDTMIASRLLTAGTKDKNELASVAKRVLDVEIDKAAQKSNWEDRLTPEQLEYAVRDVATVRDLYIGLKTAIAAAEMETVCDIEMRAIPSFTWMACAGAPFDVEAWNAVAAEAGELERTIVERLDAACPPRDGCINGDGAWNWNSPADVKAAFAQLGFNLDDTSDATLAGVDHPLAAALREHRSASQMVKTFGRKWPKVVQDGRLFAGWVQLGTDAGRSSCKQPNIQQVPRDPRYRNCFRAPEGRVLIKADYSQLQLRIACKVAQEKVMLRAYQNGDDLHMLTAVAITGKEKPSKADRKTAKAVNFGLLFGMGPERLQEYSKANYGLDLTLEQAKQYREKFFTTYPSLRKWHKEKGGSTSPETRTLLGRRRLFDDGNHYSDRLNSPVQGSEADGAKQAMALLWERREQCPGAIPVMFVHDEIVVEADVDKADAAAAWLKTAMIDGMTPVLGRVPCEVEAQITTLWGGGN